MSEDKPYKIKIKASQIILFVISIIAVYYLAPQLIDFKTTITLLWSSSWFWLGVGVVAMAASFIFAAYVQFVSGYYIGKISDILQLVLAGSLLNHFLPYSLGVIGLTTQYYAKHDQRRPRAIVMSTIPIAVGTVTVTLMTLIISPLTVMEIMNNFSVEYRPELIFVIIDIIAIIALLAAYYFTSGIN